MRQRLVIGYKRIRKLQMRLKSIAFKSKEYGYDDYLNLMSFGTIEADLFIRPKGKLWNYYGINRSSGDLWCIDDFEFGRKNK